MNKLKYILNTLVLMLFSMHLHATSLEVGAEYDFHDALDYAFYADIDTLILTTSGGIYTTTDTLPFIIFEPIVIMAADGLAEKPIFTHPNSGFLDGEPSSSMEIFRILDDVEFHGVAFMGGIEETQGLKYACRYGDWQDPTSGAWTRGKTGTRIVFNDCHFEGFHSLKDQNKQGNVLYYLRPNDLTLNHLRNTKVYIENCTFKDIGDEAIRISENEKYGGPDGVVPFDTLIVRNCTFDDIDAECIRIYGDKDTSMTGPTPVDGYLLIDHITVVNSAPRFFYGKNYRNATLRNILIAYGRGPSINRQDRGDFTIQAQLSGSTVSHVDTFSMVYTMEYSNRIGCTKGGYVDTSTIYGYQPMFVDFENGDYTLAEGSPMYNLSSDGTALGDLRWATNMPVSVKPSEIPTQFTLKQNYPNPFNPQTKIDFTLDKDGLVSLKVYDILGRLVVSPVDGYVNSGYHSVTFNASNLPTGIYFYELRSSTNRMMHKMLLMK